MAEIISRNKRMVQHIEGFIWLALCNETFPEIENK